MPTHFLWLIILLEIIGLTLCAERFIYGASALAKRWDWPPFITGVLLLAMATSLPELMVSVMAVGHQHLMLAVGGVVGSNIANSLLVLGLAAWLCPVVLRDKARRHVIVQLAVLCVATIYVVVSLRWQEHLSWVLGLVLWAGAVVYMVILWRQLHDKAPSSELSERLGHDAAAQSAACQEAVAHTQLVDDAVLAKAPPSILKASLCWFLGLCGLLLCAHYLVVTVLHLGHALGVSDAVLGLTVVALGTSLPELAASVVSAWRKQHALVLGNVIGSNCFNLLIVLAVPATWGHAAAVGTALLQRDLPWLLVITIVMSAILILPKRDHARRNLPISDVTVVPASTGRVLRLGRVVGACLTFSYLIYLFYVVRG